MDTRSIESNGWGKFSQRLASEPNRARRKRNAAAVAAKSLQSCLTLCDPIDSSPPGSLVPGILQARTLEWVAISFSNAWKWKVKVKSLSRVWLFTTPWTAAYKAPLPMGFPRQEYWSGVPLPSPRIMVRVKQVNKMSQKQVKSIPKKDDQMLPTEQVKWSLHLLVTGDIHWWHWQEQF